MPPEDGACLTSKHRYVNKALLLLGNPVEVIIFNTNEGITMKNVLFATTAMVVMAGSAMAAPTISFGGKATGGYNDVGGGLFLTGYVGATATVDMGDSVTAKVSWGGISFNQALATPITLSKKVTAEFDYTGSSYTASLRIGDLNYKGASDYWYKDRAGMQLDVEAQNDHNDARALIQFGNYGIAIGCGVANTAPLNALGSCSGMNIGLGATFGSMKLGVGYDDAANTGGSRTAVSLDTTLGSVDLGVSYIKSATANSIGVVAGKTFGSVKVGAYFAANSAVADSYGVSAAYANGPIDIRAYYDSIIGVNSTSLDVAYKVSDAVTVHAGLKNSATTNYYAGVDYVVNSNITATLSYANAASIYHASGLNFADGTHKYKNGITAMISASF